MSTKTTTDETTDEPTTDRPEYLPAPLAFLPPTRAKVWLWLRDRDEPATADDPTDELDMAAATAYRAFGDLEDHGLAERTIQIRTTGGGPRHAWTAVDGDGGGRS